MCARSRRSRVVERPKFVSLLFACLMAVAVDGDTLRCKNMTEANGRVRLARIDTPERGEPGYDEATRALAQLIEGQEVTCELVDADPRRSGFQARDRYGRPVARCNAGGRDLGATLLSGGYAVKWPK